jgi:hypothetical protein
MMPYPAKNSLFEYKLIGDIVKEYPQMSEIMQRHFGGYCLKRPGFKIQTLGMACILSGIDKNRLIQEFEKIQN